MTSAEYSPPSCAPGPVATGHWRASWPWPSTSTFRAAADEAGPDPVGREPPDPGAGRRSGRALFLRHTRGGADQRGRATAARRGPGAGAHGRRRAPGAPDGRRRSVAITTWASFCIDVADPAHGGVPARQPGIDIRIDASDVQVDLETSDVDLALRYAMPAGATQAASACLASNWPWWPAPGCSRAANRCAPPPMWRSSP